MQKLIPLLATLAFVVLSSHAFGQTQDEQQACENDAFKFCQDAIPDEDRVYDCLHKHRHEISPACRKAMVKYSRPRKRAREATEPGFPSERY